METFFNMRNVLSTWQSCPRNVYYRNKHSRVYVRVCVCVWVYICMYINIYIYYSFIHNASNIEVNE